MTRLLPILLTLLCATASAQTNDHRTLLLVVGAPGTPEYATQFAACADLWKQAAAKAGLQTTVIGLASSTDDHAQLLTALTNEVSKPSGELWLVLLGHGTYDGRTAKFNLRGPDLSASELSVALKPAQRPLAILNCASASGPFMNALSAPGRVIVTATRSGHEVSVTRLGDYLAKAIADPSADLDKDGQTSLLEAYLFASRQVDQFYKESGRLATEHPLIDDNGDSLGTPPDWFRGVRAIKTAANGKPADGVRAHQIHLARSQTEQSLPPDSRARRDELETQLSALRLRKPSLPPADYYQQLEVIMVETAKLYQGK